MNTQSQGDQPQYDVIEFDQHDSPRHQTHNREHAAAAARYVNTKRETNFAELTQL